MAIFSKFLESGLWHQKILRIFAMLFKATPAKAHAVNGSICRMEKICNTSNVKQAYFLADSRERAHRYER